MIQYREDKGSWFWNLFSWWARWGCDCDDQSCWNERTDADVRYWVDTGLMYRKVIGPYPSQGWERAVWWFRRKR